MSRPNRQSPWSQWSVWILFALRALSALLLVILIGDAILSWGGDFNVYWRAAYRLVRGGPVYAALLDETQCFKYPPFIATLLAPLGLFARETLDAPWRLLQVACLVWIARDLKRDLKSEISLHLVLLTFWGIWVFNTVTGQITLLMMAGAWLAVTGGRRAPLFWSWWGLSPKILGVLAWFAMPQWWRPRAVLTQAAAAAVISVVLTIPTLLYARGDWALYWSDLTGAIFSPSKFLDGGRNGLSALWAEVFFGAGPQSQGLHLIGAGISIVLMFLLFWWARPSRTPAMTERMRWAWATALVASVHPLAYAYAFAWAFPLGVYAVDFAWERWAKARNRATLGYLVVTVVGVVSVALLQRVPLLAGRAIPGSRALGVWMIAVAFAAQMRQVRAR